MPGTYIRWPSTTGGGGGGGSGTGFVKVDLYDPLTTSLTVGPAATDPFVVDGVTVTNGMHVLFSNLGVGNNRVYSAAISAGVITWTVVSAFTTSGGASTSSPSAGDSVIITQGDSFADQSGIFTGSTWEFNNIVRYFNGVNYFEQSSLNISTLTDNTTNGSVFTVGYTGSENIVVEFSLARGGSKEIGTLFITTDGASVAIASAGAALAALGVSFSGAISGSDLILQYTTTSTGSDATIKYNLRRWSDASGGPAGPPTYSAAAASVSAAGVNSNIQINSAGVLGASSNFSYDSTNNILELGNLNIGILSTASILDNQASAANLIAYAATNDVAIIEYSIKRGAANVRVGRLMVATDGTTVSVTDDFNEQGTAGVNFSAVISGSDIQLQYTSTSTGTAGTFKYSFRRWSA